VRGGTNSSAGDELAALRVEAEQLRYERRLLGAARMTLDLVAAGGPDLWMRARHEAAGVSQRIVDEIGNPGTDEPALGPTMRGVLGRIAAAHQKDVGARGLTRGLCVECGHGWPCPTRVWATTTTRDPGMDCWDPANDSDTGGMIN